MFNQNAKILVVDDMQTMRKIVIKVLKELGYSEISEAHDGKEAWGKVQSGGFDLIISDWNMPNGTGLDFLKRVRADDKHSKTPFILVTAEAEQHQMAEAIKCGVDQYVVKPFSKDALKLKLEATYRKVYSRLQE
jgi:two-component system chemotaxis response regulator CheY